MNRADHFLKKFIRILLAFILLAHLTLAFHSRVPLEFSSGYFRNGYYTVLAFGSPLAVFMIAILDFIRFKNSRLIVLNMFAGLFLSIVCGLTILFASFYGGDDWLKSNEVLYKHRFSNDYIVERNHHDSRGAKKTFKIKPFTTLFHWSTEIDLDSINPLAWIPETSD